MTTLPRDRIPERVIQRLAAIGVHSLADWKQLGRRRREIFGVTPRWIAELDALAREQASETTMPERSGQGPVGHLMESSVEHIPDHPAGASKAALPGV